MKRERFEAIDEAAPRMSQAARADIEALRASERLQRIFESDFQSGRRPGTARPKAGVAVAEPAPEAKAGVFASRRARVLVGLVPVYVAVAVLAAEGVSALRGEPERLAFATTASVDEEPGAGPAANGRDQAGDPARVAARLPGGDAAGGAGSAARQTLPMAAGGDADRAKAGVADRADARAADRADARAADRAAAGDAAARAASPPAAGTETDGERVARAPAPAPARATVPDTRPDARPDGGTDGRLDGGAPVPEPSAVAKAPVRSERPAEAKAAKSSDDVAKAVEVGLSALRPAEPAAAPSGAAPSVAAPSVTAPTVAAPSVAAAAPEDGVEAVPQATWAQAAPASAGEAPVPLPAPRFARLSDVLAAGAEQQRPDEVVPQPGGGLEGSGRAAPPPQSAAARAAEPSATLPQRRAGPAPEAQPQRASAPPRIVLHYPRDAGASAARRLAAELQARGFARTELRPVSFAVTQANVRYFHDQNRRVAREVNELLGAAGGRSDLRDFTHYAPLPSVGTVEVWLPG